MASSVVNKIVQTTFKWSGLDQGASTMSKVSAGAMAIGAAVAAAGMAVWQLTDRLTQTFGAFDDMSARTGIAASQLHALSLAAEQTGSDFDAITTGLRRMPSFLNDAQNGMASATQAMDALGVSVSELSGLPIERQFYRMVDALGAVQDESTRAALAQDVFGRGSQALIPLIEEGSAGLQNFAAEARRTGLVLEDDVYAAADKFQDALALMQARMQSALMEGIEPMLPRLLDTADALMTIAVEAVPTLAAAMESAMPIIQAFGSIVGTSAQGWTLIMQSLPEMVFGAAWQGPTLVDQQAAGMTMDPGLNREAMRAALGRDRLAIEEEIAAKQAEAAAALAAESSILSGGGGGGGGGESILDAERERDELISHRMQLLEKTQALEEEHAALILEKQQALIDATAELEQAENDARMERLQMYADYTTQIMGAAWDSIFGNARMGFGDMLKAMAADLAKSAVLGFLRKSIFGGLTGGAGFFIP